MISKSIITQTYKICNNSVKVRVKIISKGHKQFSIYIKNEGGHPNIKCLGFQKHQREIKLLDY